MEGRIDPQENQMCSIHHSVTQLQVSEQLSSERNSSSLFCGASLNTYDAIPRALYSFLYPLSMDNVPTAYHAACLGMWLFFGTT